MAKYRKKPVIIEAVQYIRGQEVPAVEFLGGYDRNIHKVRIGEYETDVAKFTIEKNVIKKLNLKKVPANEIQLNKHLLKKN